MNLLRYGDRGLLIEVPDAESVVALADRLRADEAMGELLADVVPGARTVLLIGRPGIAPERLCEIVPDVSQVKQGFSAAKRQGLSPITIPTRYDGPDLAEVARLTGLAEDEVVAAHTASEWRVAFGGFAPGFAYLVGGDRRLEVPRREAPRQRVATGSVGLAGEFSGIYPRESPGGWQLIGRTDVVLWDLSREEPALLTAGAAVRFESIDG